MIPLPRVISFINTNTTYSTRCLQTDSYTCGASVCASRPPSRIFQFIDTLISMNHCLLYEIIGRICQCYLASAWSTKFSAYYSINSGHKYYLIPSQLCKWVYKSLLCLTILCSFDNNRFYWTLLLVFLSNELHLRMIFSTFCKKQMINTYERGVSHG